MLTNKFFPEIHGNFGFGCMRLPMNGDKVNAEAFNQMIDAGLTDEQIKAIWDDSARRAELAQSQV